MTDFERVVERLRDLCARLVACGDVLDSITVSKAASMLEQKPRWIPVTERLPEHTRPAVLAVIQSLNGRRYVDTLYYLTWLGVWSDADDEVQMIGDEGDAVTHWMPLPEPPKEEDDD